MTYDTTGKRVRTENLAGQVTATAWDCCHKVSETQPDGAVTTWDYDDEDRMVATSRLVPLDLTNVTWVTTCYAYDNQGTRVATTRTVGSRVPRDRSDEWRKSESQSNYALVDGEVWSVRTNITSCSDAAIAPLVQSRATQLTGLTAANPVRTRTIDIRGNVTEDWSEFLDGASCAKRRVPEATNVISSRSRYGITLEEVSLSAVTNTAVYDSPGRVYTTIDGRGNATRTEYDAYGRRAATVDPIGARTTYAYNDVGELVAVTNALGHATVYEYDLRGQKAYEGGATYPVRYVYDVFGNKIAMTTYRDESQGADSGDTTRWFYDIASNCMTNKVYADGKGPKYDYDVHGQLAKRTWARGIDTFYAYDGWGNLTSTTYSDTTPAITLSYDAMGRQTEARDAAGVTTFVYDAYGVNTNETVVGVAGTNILERFHDTFGRDAGHVLNGVRQSTLGYDPSTGRLATMLAAGSDTPFAWNYVAGSDLKSSLTYPNGLIASWTYGNRGELLEVDNALPSGSVSKYVYTYDAAGRRIGCAKSGSAFTTSDNFAYSYNVRSELTNAVAAVDSAYRYGYQFDDIGNREISSERGTNSVYTANNLNQYTAVDDFVPQFDDDGNQTLVKTATGIWQVTYNGENRPVRWMNGDASITMSYDRMGRRVTKNDQRFVYDGYLQIADNACNAYVWDPTEPVATRPLAWRHDGETFFYTHDSNKNVSEVMVADGTLAAHYEYAPFGTLTVSCGGEGNADNPVPDHYSLLPIRSLNPWRFSSEYGEDGLGLVYYNYRHYEPFMGRWLSRDLLVGRDILVLYSFCCNRDYFYDALGLFSPHPQFGFDRDFVVKMNQCKPCEVKIAYVSQRKEDDTDGFEHSVAEILKDDFGPNNTYRIKELKDFMPNRVIPSQCCVKTLAVAGHGGYEKSEDKVKLVLGRIWLYESSDTASKKGSTAISDLIKYSKIRFCQRCTIELRSCVLGLSSVLKTRLEGVTKCDVILYAYPIDQYGKPWKEPWYKSMFETFNALWNYWTNSY